MTRHLWEPPYSMLQLLIESWRSRSGLSQGMEGYSHHQVAIAGNPVVFARASTLSTDVSTWLPKMWMRDVREHLQLCFICLKPIHKVKVCASHLKCKENDCGRKHPTLFHVYASAPSALVLLASASSESVGLTSGNTASGVCNSTRSALHPGRYIISAGSSIHQGWQLSHCTHRCPPGFRKPTHLDLGVIVQRPCTERRETSFDNTDYEFWVNKTV